MNGATAETTWFLPTGHGESSPSSTYLDGDDQALGTWRPIREKLVFLFGPWTFFDAVCLYFFVALHHPFVIFVWLWTVLGLLWPSALIWRSAVMFMPKLPFCWFLNVWLSRHFHVTCLAKNGVLVTNDGFFWAVANYGGNCSGCGSA